MGLLQKKIKLSIKRFMASSKKYFINQWVLLVLYERKN